VWQLPRHTTRRPRRHGGGKNAGTIREQAYDSHDWDDLLEQLEAAIRYARKVERTT
jgi:hypothetical protein